MVGSMNFALALDTTSTGTTTKVHVPTAKVGLESLDQFSTRWPIQYCNGYESDQGRMRWLPEDSIACNGTQIWVICTVCHWNLQNFSFACECVSIFSQPDADNNRVSMSPLSLLF